MPEAEGNAGDETNGRGVAWRGEAGGGGGARVDVPLVLILIHVGKNLPYKEAQLPLN